MTFYLGTHEPTWLGRLGVPLFVSFLRLYERCKRKLPKARCRWALDGSGFSVLDSVRFGHRYPWPPAEYAAKVREYRDRIGLLDWAAIQDWMCEERVLRKTGLTVAEHQRRTVRSWLDLTALAPDLPWLPVVQGFTREEYLRCVDLYAAAGTDLTRVPLVGIGSVCRRQDTAEAEAVIRDLAGRGLRLHGFGFKIEGLANCADVLASADSLAWSDAARRIAYRGRAGLDKRAAAQPASPQNNPATALAWREKVMAAVAGGRGV